MQCNPFTVNKGGNSGYRLLVCLFLLAAMVPMSWSPSLAGKIAVIDLDDKCPAGTQCDSVPPDGASPAEERTGDQVTDDGDEGRKYDDVSLRDEAVAGIPDYYYAYTFSNADETGGNAILFGDSATGAYGKGYKDNLSGFAPKGHGVVETVRYGGIAGSSDMVHGTRPAYAPRAANFGFDSIDLAPVQNRADFLAKDQGSNLPTVAGRFEPVIAETNAVFGNSSHTSVHVAGRDQKYRAGQFGGGSSPLQSPSLSLGQEVEAGSFTVRDFFGLKDDQKDSSKPIGILILMGVGILQALILGVIVIRILVERAR